MGNGLFEAFLRKGSCGKEKTSTRLLFTSPKINSSHNFRQIDIGSIYSFITKLNMSEDWGERYRTTCKVVSVNGIEKYPADKSA